MKEGPEMNRRKFLGVLGAGAGAAALAGTQNAEAGENNRKEPETQGAYAEAIERLKQEMAEVETKKTELNEAADRGDATRVEELRKEIGERVKRITEEMEELKAKH